MQLILLTANIVPTKMKFTVRYTRQITALGFFAILIFSDKSIFLSKYIVLYAFGQPNLTFKFNFNLLN